MVYDSLNREFVCFIYSELLSDQLKKEERVGKPKSPFKLTEGIKKKWEKEKPTELQKRALKKMGYPREEIESMNKLDVHNIFENTKRRNI
jgi:hypothetical protein